MFIFVDTVLIILNMPYWFRSDPTRLLFRLSVALRTNLTMTPISTHIKNRQWVTCLDLNKSTPICLHLSNYQPQGQTPMRLSRTLSIVSLPVIFAASLSLFPMPAQADTLEEAVARIDISGRQRMFAQRMAGLSCLVSLNIDAETHAREVLEIRDQYRATLESLLDGNPEINMTAETDPNVKAAIASAVTPFEELSVLLSVFETQSTLSAQRLRAISVVSRQVFETAAALTSKIQSSRSSEMQNLALIDTMIINIAGRQRMLAEKTAKLLCLAQVGINVEGNLQELAETEAVFESTMDALINGMPGVLLPPPTEEIGTKLEHILAVWTSSRSIRNRAAQGVTLNAADIVLVVGGLKTVRIMINEVVKLYNAANAE